MLCSLQSYTKNHTRWFLCFLLYSPSPLYCCCTFLKLFFTPLFYTPLSQQNQHAHIQPDPAIHHFTPLYTHTFVHHLLLALLHFHHCFHPRSHPFLRHSLNFTDGCHPFHSFSRLYFLTFLFTSLQCAMHSLTLSFFCFLICLFCFIFLPPPHFFVRFVAFPFLDHSHSTSFPLSFIS